MHYTTASMEEKLLELGWERKYFPSWVDFSNMVKWKNIVKQPRPLSDRSALSSLFITRLA